MQHLLPDGWFGAEWWVQVGSLVVFWRYSDTQATPHAAPSCQSPPDGQWTRALLVLPLHCRYSHLYGQAMSLQRFKPPTDSCSCQIYEHGRGLAFHFDKDEHLLSKEGRMVHPIVNSIIYLTGDSAESRLGAC